MSLALVSFNYKNFLFLDRWCFVFTILNILVQTTSFIWCHVARWSHSGRVCSGDYLSNLQYNNFIHDLIPNDYLIKEGLFLKWWVISNWIFFGSGLICLCGCLIFLQKIKSNLHLGITLRD